MDISRVLPGKPGAYGATILPDGINFALFSKNAERVILNLFDAPNAKQPCDIIELDPCVNKTGDVWHVFIKNAKAGTLYLYQIDGPYNPPAGHRFNINKYLVDPYAKAFTDGSIFRSYGKQRAAGLAGIENGKLSDLSDFPKCVVVDEDDFDWQGDKPLNRPLSETIIYEAHVKGFTRSHTSGVSCPGTYRGFIEKIPYLQYLGVTAVELMPMFEFDEFENERVNPRTGEKLTNYWGYSTIGFFAPKTSYAADRTPGGAVREFKELVRELHKAGIEVILDVVYNHTAEGNEHGITFCFRGIENSIYYMLVPEQKQYYNNYSGCGNTMNTNHPVVGNFILDSLRHWVLDMHVDGFRFDLATALCRAQNGHMLSDPPLPHAISEDPILAKTKLIAEPWDIGGYQLGNFPGSRWCEWNGRFRDDIRRFIRGDEHTATEAATRLAGSSDLYRASGRQPVHSINFVTAHDGFTLNDVVSYNYKHNEENGEYNQDGSDDNISYNNGYEGESTNPKINKTRIRKIKNFLTCLLLAEGTPMLLAGDEMMRTQRGNNNAYCHDNELSWMHWHDCDTHKEILLYTKALIQLRKTYAAFRRNKFFMDSSELCWYDANGKNPDWTKSGRFLAYRLDEIDDGIGVNEFYFAINTDIYDLTITLPSPAGGKWYRIADTSIDGGDDIREPGNEELLHEQQRYVLLSDSLVLLMSK
ncbi:MAG: glycogen debranching protein GlgX [Treponema sp.]|nr:glycogen debranching protein GlgX [Treponema sp.]